MTSLEIPNSLPYSSITFRLRSSKIPNNLFPPELEALALLRPSVLPPSEPAPPLGQTRGAPLARGSERPAQSHPPRRGELPARPPGVSSWLGNDNRAAGRSCATGLSPASCAVQWTSERSGGWPLIEPESRCGTCAETWRRPTTTTRLAYRRCLHLSRKNAEGIFPLFVPLRQGSGWRAFM